MSRVENNTNVTKKKKKKKRTPKALLMLIIVLALMVGLGGIYTIGTGAVEPGNEEMMLVEIPNGSGASAIVEILDQNGLIKNKFCCKVSAKLGRYSSLQANTYTLNKGMSFRKIMNIINTGDFDYVSKESIVIKDGLRLQQVAEAMAEQLNLSKDSIMDKWSDKEYLKKLIDKYWFLTDDILDKDIMYPLEGYLYADTYFIATDDPSIEELTEMCLDRMDEELTSRKSKIEASGFSVHELLTLTSIVTKESSADDQAKVAGVFMNRLNDNISLGSDVTVCYIFQEDRVELKVSQLDSDSPYNTRKFTGLPPSPIAAVTGSGIDATLDYEKSDYLFFFADNDGVVHYYKTEADFEKGIDEEGLLKDDDSDSNE